MERHGTGNEVNRRLTTKMEADPSFDLVKLRQRCKGTALRTVNDLDVAVQVKAGPAPRCALVRMPGDR